MKHWIARDKDGKLYLYGKKPNKDKIYYYVDMNECVELDKDLFPEVTWENGPKQVEINVNSAKQVELKLVG